MAISQPIITSNYALRDVSERNPGQQNGAESHLGVDFVALISLLSTCSALLELVTMMELSSLKYKPPNKGNNITKYEHLTTMEDAMGPIVMTLVIVC